MKTFRDSGQTIEAYLLEQERCCKGVAIIDYGFLLAELFQLFRNEMNYKEIVTMLPKDIPKELTPGYCYFLPQVEGIEIISSLRILEIDHLLFHGYNCDKIVTLSLDKTKEENHQSSPVTSLDSTPRSSWINNTSRIEFSTPSGVNTSLSSIVSTPPKQVGHSIAFESIDAPSSTASRAIPPKDPVILQLDANIQETVSQRSVDLPPSSEKSLPFRQSKSTVASPVRRQKSDPVGLQNKSSDSFQISRSPGKSSTPKKRGRPVVSRNNLNSDSPPPAEYRTSASIQFILDKLSEYDEVSWERGVRRGLRTLIPREDVLLLEGKFESMGWKICSGLERSDWWSKERCYLPPWSPLIQQPEGEFIVGIDIFWCLDDCLKYLKIFHNSEPLSRRKGRGVQSLRINLTEDSPVEFLNSLLDERDPDSQFFSVWNNLKSSGWRILEVDATLLSIPTNKVAIPYWTVLSSNMIDLSSFRKLKLNQDYFFFVQDLVSYLQIVGNQPTKSMREFPVRDQRYPQFPFPTFDSSGKEDPVDVQERRLICRLAQSPDLSQDDITFLESLDWSFSTKFASRVYILSPWGVLKSASKLSQLQQDFDYFRSPTDVVSFILNTGSCRTQPSGQQNVGGDLSICSPSLASEEEEEEDDDDDDDIAPIKSQSDLEQELRRTIAASGQNYVFPMIRGILSDLGWKFEDRMNAKVESAIIFSPWGWELYKNSSKKPLLHGRDYFVDHNEVVTYVSQHQNKSCSDAALKKTFPRRSLAGSGAKLFSSEIILKSEITSKEVILKSTMQTVSKKNLLTNPPVKAAATRKLSKSPEKVVRSKEERVPASNEIIPNKNFKYTYQGEDLCPSLGQVGFEGQIKLAINTSVDSYFFSMIRLILLELGWDFHYRYKGSSVNLAPWADASNSIVLRLGVDYFLNPRDICEYLTKHGHKPISGEPSRRRSSSSTAITEKFTAIVEQKKKNIKKTSREPKRDNVPRVGVDDVTLTQIQSMENQMDSRCSEEIKLLLERAVQSRPRLNLSVFEEVWEVLSGNGWNSETSADGESYVRLSNEGVKTHFFENKNDVLDFIQKQIVARGQNYTTLVDRACFYPSTSFPDEECDESIEEPELIDDDEDNDDEEETEDLNDVSDMNISSPLLDALSSYAIENPPPSNELKRKSFSRDSKSIGGGFLEELDAEIETKRLRTEIAPKEPSQLLLPMIESAKHNLIPSHVPTFPLGREDEYQQLLLCLDQMTRSSCGSLRISGLHGQGKTVTTQIAIQRYQESGAQFQVVWISAAMISSFQDIIKALPISSTPSNLPLQQLLHQSSSSILLVIDEIDLLQARIRETLVSLANTAGSKLMLVGLENSVHSGAFHHSITFQAYNDTSLSRILDSLTNNLFDEKSLKYVSKTFATKGDVRPMKVFALKCLELAQEKLTADDIDSPLKAIVDMKIVNQCRKDVNPSMTSVLLSLHKQSLHLLVSLVCSYLPGQLFSLCDMQNAINTFYLKRRMSEIGMDMMCAYGEALLQDGLLCVDREKKQFSSLNQYLQESEVPYFSIGYEPDYLLDSLTESDIGEMALRELIDTANQRNPPSPVPFKRPS